MNGSAAGGEHDAGCRRCGRPVDFSPPVYTLTHRCGLWWVGDESGVSTGWSDLSAALVALQRRAERSGRLP